MGTLMYEVVALILDYSHELLQDRSMPQLHSSNQMQSAIISVSFVKINVLIVELIIKTLSLINMGAGSAVLAEMGYPEGSCEMWLCSRVTLVPQWARY